MESENKESKAIEDQKVHGEEDSFFLKDLYHWVLHWAYTPYGTPALIILSFAESSFFPIPPDPLLMAMALSRPRHSFLYALFTTLASLAGAVVGYLIGSFLWSTFGDFFFNFVPGFTPKVFALVETKYHENAFWAIMTAGFTPIPFKVFTIAAGAVKISWTDFLLGAAVGRSMRFFIVSALLYFLGPRVKIFIERYFNLLSILFVILLIGGFALVKYLAD